MKPRVQARKKIKTPSHGNLVPEFRGGPVRPGQVRVLKLVPRERVARPFDVPNDLRSLQALLGGDLEAATPKALHDLGIALYVDEHGGPEYRGLPLNLRTGPESPTIRGPVLFCGLDAAGETVSITPGQHEAVVGWLRDECEFA